MLNRIPTRKDKVRRTVRKWRPRWDKTSNYGSRVGTVCYITECNSGVVDLMSLGSARESAANIRLKIGERVRFRWTNVSTSSQSEYPAGSLPCGSYWLKERPSIQEYLQHAKKARAAASHAIPYRELDETQQRALLKNFDLQDSLTRRTARRAAAWRVHLRAFGWVAAELRGALPREDAGMLTPWLFATC